MKNGVLLCAIGKMENNYIREWVEHYKSIGFRNICLFDNNDIDGERFEDKISDYIDSGFVILKDARGYYRYQIESYNVCYKEYKDTYEWIAFFDIDEFLELDVKYNNNINNFVNDDIFKSFNCIRVCWENYDDNGHVRVINNNYSIKRFTKARIGDNQTKGIVKTVFNEIKNNSPHILSQFVKFNSCNSVGCKCKTDILIPNRSLKNAKLKHYRFKTIEEYVTNKMVRLWPTDYGNGGKDKLNLDFFFRFNNKTVEKIEIAKQLMNKKPTIYFNGWYKIINGKPLSHNWGDDINLKMFNNCTNLVIKPYKKGDNVLNYLVIGSVLSNHFSNKQSIVWGSGCPSYNEEDLKEKPKKICSVRGPLTRSWLIKQGIDCPEIYGDPAFLLPLIYNKKVKKTHKYGLIPHFSNIGKSLVNNFAKKYNCKIINLSKYKNWTDIIDEILSCECIISESLHGLIVSESYGIPYQWVDFGENKYKNKGYFKYHDFLLSIGKEICDPLMFNENTTIDDFEKLFENFSFGEKIDTNKLIKACPFKLNLFGNTKLYGMTLTHNESKMIPFIMPYYERLGYDKLIVYDNESTDNTVELLKQYPFVEVRTFSTNGKKNNSKNQLLKNEFAKEYIAKSDKNTWVTITDFDEVLYYNGNFKQFLNNISKNGYNCLHQCMVELVSEKFPTFDKNKLIHQQCDFCRFWTDLSGGYKLTLFKPSDFSKIVFSPGSHRVSVKVNCPIKALNYGDIKSLHIKYIGKDNVFEKINKAKEIRSDEDKRKNYGNQYEKYSKPEEFEKLWRGLHLNKISIENYINGIIGTNNNVIKSTDRYFKIESVAAVKNSKPSVNRVIYNAIYPIKTKSNNTNQVVKKPIVLKKAKENYETKIKNIRHEKNKEILRRFMAMQGKAY